MSFASRHNKGAVFQCDTEGFEYFSLEVLYQDNGEDTVYPIQGLYINHKSDYGDAPVAILEDKFVNLPQHLLDEALEIMKNDDDVADIKAGKVGFTIYQYEKELKKGSKICYGIRWVDV